MDTQAYLSDLIKKSHKVLFSNTPAIIIHDKAQYEQILSFFNDNSILHVVENSASTRFKNDGQDYYLRLQVPPAPKPAVPKAVPEPVKEEVPATTDTKAEEVKK